MSIAENPQFYVLFEMYSSHFPYLGFPSLPGRKKFLGHYTRVFGGAGDFSRGIAP
jgi:hypothetical protein